MTSTINRPEVHSVAKSDRATDTVTRRKSNQSTANQADHRRRGRSTRSLAKQAGSTHPRTIPTRRPVDYAQRVPFVVVMLLLIGAGVSGTLWLSAQSTEETYALKAARTENVHLVEQMEALLASNERARSAEVLAERAQKLGMVGVDSAPILVEGDDGNVDIIGAEEATLGAPIEPLQPAPVPSEALQPPADGFGIPPAQAPQDDTPRGVAPVPYPPVTPAPLAPPPAMPAPASAPEAEQPPVDPDLAANLAAPADEAGLPATLEPVPGPAH